MARKKNADAALQLGLPADYVEFLESLKARVRQSQTKAMLSVNRELIALYWDIGRQIVERQEREGWGKSVVDRLASDLQQAFPGVKGFSPRNIWRMRAFFLAYRASASNLTQAASEIGTPLLPQLASEITEPLLPQAVAEIPWYHNVILLEKVKDADQRLWYAAKTLEHGWSRTILTVQIESNLNGRQGKVVSNFAGTLPAPQSDLAQQALKDPYLFDFLTLPESAAVRTKKKFSEGSWDCGSREKSPQSRSKKNLQKHTDYAPPRLADLYNASEIHLARSRPYGQPDQESNKFLIAERQVMADVNSETKYQRCANDCGSQASLPNGRNTLVMLRQVAEQGYPNARGRSQVERCPAPVTKKGAQ